MINHFSTSLCFSESVEALAFLVPAVGRPRTLAIFTFGAIYIAATLQLFEYEEFLAKLLLNFLTELNPDISNMEQGVNIGWSSARAMR